MQIAEIMTPNVNLASPEDTLREAAKKMAEWDIGALPVEENDRLVGMITDRDIVVRGLAAGKRSDECKVREVMSGEVKYVFEDETTEDLANNMRDLQVRRLPVLNREKRLVGVVSLGDLATTGEERPTQEAIQGVSQPTSISHPEDQQSS